LVGKNKQKIKIKAQNVLFSTETTTVTSLNNKKLQELNYSPKQIQYIHIHIYLGGLEFSISLPNTETNNQTASPLCSNVIEGLCFVYVPNTITWAAFGVINTCRMRSCFHLHQNFVCVTCKQPAPAPAHVAQLDEEITHPPNTIKDVIVDIRI
jgi:hypothetical protein